MKKWIVWITALLMVILLTGCGKGEVFETMNDHIEAAPVAATQPMQSILPEEAAVATWQSENGGKLFLCDGYTVTAHTTPSGDVNATIQTLSGYEKDQLTVMQTETDRATRYEFVWSCAGETGQRLGRGVILDDGNYHYCLSVLRDADAEKSQIVWSDVFASFQLV